MGPVTTPEQNELAISQALLAKVESDYVLAEALFENYINGYYRLLGYRSVPEFLREHFRDKEQDRTARLHARAFQRLIREYRLTREIPAFRAVFDKISRSNRRLIAQVLTPENAAEWIERALTLTYRDLEELTKTTPAHSKPEELVTKRFKLYPGQLELLERALAAAAKLIEGEGADPHGPDGPKMELLCQEFIATYGDGFKPFTACECVGCGRFTVLQRCPTLDIPDGEGKAIVFECTHCHATLVMKKV